MLIKVVIWVVLTAGGHVHVETTVPGHLYVPGKSPTLTHHKRCETLARALFDQSKVVVQYGPVKRVDFGCNQEYGT